MGGHLKLQNIFINKILNKVTNIQAKSVCTGPTASKKYHASKILHCEEENTSTVFGSSTEKARDKTKM